MRERACSSAAADALPEARGRRLCLTVRAQEQRIVTKAARNAIPSGEWACCISTSKLCTALIARGRPSDLSPPSISAVGQGTMHRTSKSTCACGSSACSLCLHARDR
jgi:hypothetical protein